MTPVNEKVQGWAIQRGLKTPYQGAVLIQYGGHQLSVGYLQGIGIAVSVILTEKKLDRKIQKKMQKETKRGNKVVPNKAKGYLHYVYQYKRKDDFGEITDQAIEDFVNLLNENQVQTQQLCAHCGLGETDSGMEIEPGIIAPAHIRCKKEYATQKLEQIQKNQSTGNYLTGTLGGLIGGMIGALPALLLHIFASMYSLWLYLIIPMGIVVGYKKSKGIADNYMRFLAVVLALTISFMTYVVGSYYHPYFYGFRTLKKAKEIIDGKSTISYEIDSYPEVEEMVELYPMIFGNHSGELTFQRYQQAIDVGIYHNEDSLLQYLPNAVTKPWIYDHRENLVPMMIYALIGVAISWRQFSRTNQDEEKELRALLAVDGESISDDPEHSPIPQIEQRFSEKQKEVSGEHLFEGQPTPDFQQPEEPVETHYEELFSEILEEDSEENPPS